ncbi:MAG TPA: winged helix-turn-helix domain-containing protein [Ilumatobacteraceae bacterium]|nr:winged helix-turn-helix domain-containing protein [Ilumatobacteraceae bacterium]
MAPRTAPDELADDAADERADDAAWVPPVDEGSWTFLTNHSHVLICLARDPELRLRDLAEQVGITERAVQGIVKDLVTAGCLNRHRTGRRNRYDVVADRPMRHRVERQHVVGDLLDAMAPVDD